MLKHMRDGAKLHRGFGDHTELGLPSGVVLVPLSIFDQLIDEHRIEPEEGGSFYCPT